MATRDVRFYFFFSFSPLPLPFLSTFFFFSFIYIHFFCDYFDLCFDVRGGHFQYLTYMICRAGMIDVLWFVIVCRFEELIKDGQAAWLAGWQTQRNIIKLLLHNSHFAWHLPKWKFIHEYWAGVYCGGAKPACLQYMHSESFGQLFNIDNFTWTSHVWHMSISNVRASKRAPPPHTKKSYTRHQVSVRMRMRELVAIKNSIFININRKKLFKRSEANSMQKVSQYEFFMYKSDDVSKCAMH